MEYLMSFWVFTQYTQVPLQQCLFQDVTSGIFRCEKVFFLAWCKTQYSSLLSVAYTVQAKNYAKSCCAARTCAQPGARSENVTYSLTRLNLTDIRSYADFLWPSVKVSSVSFLLRAILCFAIFTDDVQLCISFSGIVLQRRVIDEVSVMSSLNILSLGHNNVF